MIAPLACLLASSLAQQPAYSFVEVGAAHGLLPYPMAEGMAAGVAAVDYDRDGDIDLFVPTAGGAPNRLYRNDGTGHFTEAAASVGLDSHENHRGALWFDADGDGDLDLVVGGDDFAGFGAAPTSLRFYRQRGDGTFIDRTKYAGLWRQLLPNPDTHLGGMAVGDVNGDGFLDLLVTYWEGWAHLYLNDGTGRFLDAAQPSGLHHMLPYWQPVLHDFNDDGHLDVFQAVDFLPNRLWINQGDGTFVDLAPQAGVDSAFNEMGVALGDYDVDGRLDLYVTNQFGPGEHNLLYRRRLGALAFDEVSAEAHVQDSGCGWGTTFLDADHDGLPELAACNAGAASSTRFFANRGGAPATFVDVGGLVGLSGARGTGLVAFDMDADGDLDLAQVTATGQLRLFENTLPPAPERGFLIVRPRMTGANPLAYGAVVRVIAPARPLMTRAILAGSSLLGQEPAEAHFGVGDAASLEVRVRWPDGTLSVVSGVAPGQVLVVDKP